MQPSGSRGRSATAKSRSNAAARFSATSRRNRLVNWGRLPCRAGSQLSYRMIDPVFINIDCAGAPGAGVPPVSLRAEARPADLRRPVPHPKPGVHSPTVAAEKPVARLTVQVHLKPAWRQWPRRHLAQRRVLRRLSGTHGRSRLRRPPQRRAFHQRTTALRPLSRLARGDPDDLFRQDDVPPANQSPVSAVGTKKNTKPRSRPAVTTRLLA